MSSAAGALSIRKISYVKAAVAAGAFALSMACAPVANATAYFLETATMNTSRTVTIDGPAGFHTRVVIAPTVFTAYEGVGPVGLSSELFAFCLDIFHPMTTGTINLQYDDNFDLTTNSQYQTVTPFVGATTLSQAQVVQVGRLVNYGTAIYRSGPLTSTQLIQLSGLQGAIWKVINPDYTFSSTVAVNARIAQYSAANYLSQLTGYGPVRAGLIMITQTGLYGTAEARQGFGMGVPEPATWGLMIGGFATVGAMLRRRRAVLARA
jgi:hypothetical protein